MKPEWERTPFIGIACVAGPHTHPVEVSERLFYDILWKVFPSQSLLVSDFLERIVSGQINTGEPR